MKVLPILTIIGSVFNVAGVIFVIAGGSPNIIFRDDGKSFVIIWMILTLPSIASTVLMGIWLANDNLKR